MSRRNIVMMVLEALSLRAKMTDTKFCKDCKYYKYIRYTGPNHPFTHACTHPKTQPTIYINAINGKPIGDIKFSNAEVLRGVYGVSNGYLCGKSGELFEPKPKRFETFLAYIKKLLH